jgi:hypothetical protein
MDLHGTIVENLGAAVVSAERLRGHAVYQETLQFWRDLVAHARAEKRTGSSDDTGLRDDLVAKLEVELSDRG